MATKSTGSESEPRTSTWRSQTNSWSSQCRGECLENRAPQCDPQIHGRFMYVTWLLHSSTHHLVYHEAVDLAAGRQWSDNAEGDPDSAQYRTFDSRPGLQMAQEMQHRLNLCIKTKKQNTHPRTLVAFVIETLCAVIQYYRTIGNIWDSLYAKHQLRDSDITQDRVYSMLSELLIELKLNEEEEKITDGCQHGHRCPKYHPRRQPGRCAICGSTLHYTSQCTRPVPKRRMPSMKRTLHGRQKHNGKNKHGRMKNTKLRKVRKEKASDPRPTQSQALRSHRAQPKPKPEARSCVADGFLFVIMTSKSKSTWRYATWNSTDDHNHEETWPQTC